MSLPGDTAIIPSVIITYSLTYLSMDQANLRTAEQVLREYYNTRRVFAGIRIARYAAGTHKYTVSGNPSNPNYSDFLKQYGTTQPRGCALVPETECA